MLAKLPVQLAYRLGLLDRWLAAQDPRRLCKRLALEGYEHLVAADEARQETSSPLVIQLDERGPWQIALWVIAYYRGPVELADDAASRGGVAAWPAELIARSSPRRVVFSDGSGESILARAEILGKRLRVVFHP